MEQKSLDSGERGRYNMHRCTHIHVRENIMAKTIELANDARADASPDLQYYQDYFKRLFHSNFFKCLNDETRQKILLLVGQYGERGVRVADIAGNFDLDRTTISHHLAMLRDSDLVGVTRKGKERYYSVNSDYMIGALEEVLDIFKSCRNGCRQNAGCDSGESQA